MGKIEEYTAKKEEYTTKLAEVNKNIILTEQSITQYEEVFQKQFGTIDIGELDKLVDSYQQTIIQKQSELAVLEEEIQ